MPLSDLTDPAAINAAMDEFDRIGRTDFLQKYGFGPSRTYFVCRDDKYYDSKAIAGAALGFQHPEMGALRSDDFSGGENTVVPLLEKLGFSVERKNLDSNPILSSADVELIRQSRSRDKYADFSDEERTAHQQVHEVLQQLGAIAIDELGGSRDYVLKLTSQFHPNSGVRGGKPKDLWFGIYRKENETRFLGNPQVFMIVSGRGAEYGFAPLTHPDDFSNQAIKERTREIASSVLEQLPAPATPEAEALAAQLLKLGKWRFRRKQRLDPNQSEFSSLDAWLTFVRSDAGARNAGGGITKYALISEIDGIDFVDEVRQMARLFRPLMERVIADAPPTIAVPRSTAVPPTAVPPPTVPPIAPQSSELPSFAILLRDFLREFDSAREGPFQKIPTLWEAMSNVKRSLERFESVRSRSDILVDISVGQGNWAAIPWIALLNTEITRSTQEGIYVVFLIARTLDRVFLTLNQGTTNLVRALGQREAQQHMLEVAVKTRPLISELRDAGFVLDNDISLGGDNWLARNYEVGTIGYVAFDSNETPTDERLNELLEAVLRAYDTAVNAPRPERPPAVAAEVPPSKPEPYGIDDALAELFIEQSSLERLLMIWEEKKNLILQGAPGVGKSFIAKPLSYLLLGEKDDGRIESVQFHQSYSYEDFVQGYRPDGKGGFILSDGVFYRFCQKATMSPRRRHVFLIDEINRGNLSKIFGELMLLVEHDKRGPEWAQNLTYSTASDARFFVPDNVFIIGMMNTADRSLSIVDYALRRRFSFALLEPMFESQKFQTLIAERGVPAATVDLIVDRMTALNKAISEDRANLGPSYRIGHSFFVPPKDFEYDEDWYGRVVETEICPLLEEYWFDDPDKVDDWRKQLLQNTL
jgi:hypothetical protein